MKSKKENIVSRIKKKIITAYAFISAIIMQNMVTFASGGANAGANAGASAGGTGGGTTPTAEDKWDTVIGFILPWITRLGGVVILIGAIEFGLAFKNDDAEGKTKGMRTIIAGCIVTAVGLSSDIFLS